MLLYILNNGSDLGVHTICWGDNIRNIERIIGRTIYEFGIRIALQMNIADSNDIIESSAASKLGRYKAILYDEEKAGYLEKFRPYVLPRREWLVDVASKLKKKAGILHDSLNSRMEPKQTNEIENKSL